MPGIEESTFRISINPRVIKANNIIDMPKVLMNVNEFVIGDLILVGDERRAYDYYTVKLPFESDYIIFDFQADSPNLIVNVGPDRPTIQTDCFNFPPVGSDTVYEFILIIQIVYNLLLMLLKYLCLQLIQKQEKALILFISEVIKKFNAYPKIMFAYLL